MIYMSFVSNLSQDMISWMPALQVLDTGDLIKDDDPYRTAGQSHYQICSDLDPV